MVWKKPAKNIVETREDKIRPSFVNNCLLSGTVLETVSNMERKRR